MTNPTQKPGQQNQNPGQKPGQQQQGGGQKPGQQQQDPSRRRASDPTKPQSGPVVWTSSSEIEEGPAERRDFSFAPRDDPSPRPLR